MLLLDYLYLDLIAGGDWNGVAGLVRRTGKLEKV